jgi:non-ribosomal peptide synthetase component F
MEEPEVSVRLAYWKPRLAGLPQLSTFPPDAIDCTRPTGHGETVDFELSSDLYSGIRRLARQSNATVYMVLLAATAAVLFRHTGQTDLALGSPVGTRMLAELENVIGPIVNPLVMRLDLGDEPTFAQLLAQAREAVLDGHAHQDVPFERIVQELNPERSLGHSPLFQVAVVLHNAPEGGATLTGGGAIYDLTLFARERDGSLAGAVEYRTDLYDRATIERIVRHLERLLEAAVENPHQGVSTLPLQRDAEAARLLAEFNGTAKEVDRSPLVEQFARAAARHASSVAVVAGDETLTYGELASRARTIAARLHSAGVRRGDAVGLAVDRSFALPAAALGILEAGAAYVPLDLDYPADRVAFMLRDSSARHIVTTQSLAPAVQALDADA